MATAKLIRAAVTEAVDYSLKFEPKDIDRRCDCFVSYLAGWLRAGEPGIAADLRRLQDRPANPADGA